MSIPEKAVSWAMSIANDNSHGYDQGSRWGPDYDCSSLVISAYEYAGAKVKTNGATYTGNMYPVFMRSGFSDVTSKINLATGAGLQVGDVLLNVTTHTAMCIGGGRIVHASGNERGGVVSGLTGDQNGREIATANYFNFPWNYVLRYTAGNAVPVQPSKPSSATPSATPSQKLDLKVGQTVFFNGSCHYVSSTSDTRYPCKSGKARVTAVSYGSKHPYHLVSVTPGNGGVYGWVDASDIDEQDSSPQSGTPTTPTTSGNTYTVQAGDNLSTIAYKLLGNWARYTEIKKLNNLPSDMIYPGQVLVIPDK